ncbi:MAG TPA: MoxR family ATPase [Clostridia bacterium]|nr:MoxR family ATPase [Clostridia bacterium]
MEITQDTIKSFARQVEAIEKEIGREMIGQKEIIRQTLMTIIAGGNALLEGVPGLGKTRLVRTIGNVLDLEFSRIQFTPDLMPADVVGTNIIARDRDGNSRFEFQPGPIFGNIVLADEINRATPKTQSALLEAMQEHTVTVGRDTRKLPQPYFVLATQNPLEQEGTYPLPEAQLDRFFFKLMVKFPSLDELDGIVNLTTMGEEKKADKVAQDETILQLRSIAQQVPIAKGVQNYALRLVLATQPEGENASTAAQKYVRYGSSPRGAQAIISAARIRALMEGRYNVSFDDIRYVAYPALRHRIILNFEGIAEGRNPDNVLEEIIGELGE